VVEWPAGWERTPRRRDSRFGKHSLAVRVSALMAEVRRMGGTNLRIDHDLQTYSKSGVEVPYANQPQPDDPGVVVYFTLSGNRKVCWPCDRWRRVEDNLWAIVKSLEAKRGLERWGAVSMDREYEGYLQLPESTANQRVDAHTALGIAKDAPWATIRAAWRAWAKEHHPDRGGDHDRFTAMNSAVQRILEVERP